MQWKEDREVPETLLLNEELWIVMSSGERGSVFFKGVALGVSAILQWISHTQKYTQIRVNELLNKTQEKDVIWVGDLRRWGGSRRCSKKELW